MKLKKYFKPTVANLEIGTIEFLAISVDISIGEEQETGRTDVGNHKGAWGNLWR